MGLFSVLTLKILLIIWENQTISPIPFWKKWTKKKMKSFNDLLSSLSLSLPPSHLSVHQASSWLKLPAIAWAVGLSRLSLRGKSAPRPRPRLWNFFRQGSIWQEMYIIHYACIVLSLQKERLMDSHVHRVVAPARNVRVWGGWVWVSQCDRESLLIA